MALTTPFLSVTLLLLIIDDDEDFDEMPATKRTPTKAPNMPIRASEVVAIVAIPVL